MNGNRLLTYDIKINSKVSYYNRGKGIKDVGIVNMVMTNILACVRKGYGLVYSRRKGTPPLGKRRVTARKIIRAVEYLHKEGLITNTVGVSSAKTEDRVISCISATDKLLNILSTELNLIDEDYLEAEEYYLTTLPKSELRDPEENMEDYFNFDIDSKEKMEAVVEKLNKLNNQFDVFDGDGVLMENSYCRIFNKNYSLGGRWYRADVLAIKNKDTKARLDITIGGSSVVEVDYRGMHFQIAAALADHVTDFNIPSDVYAYLLRDDDYSDVDYDVLKQSVNIMFNCNSQASSFAAINKLIRELPEESKSKLSLTRAKFIAQMVEDDFPEIYTIMNGGIYDYGLALQNADSKLAESIIEVLTEKGIPVLPVHDSFIVRFEDIDELLNNMGKLFREKFKVSHLIPVKIQYKSDGKIYTEEAMV